MKNYEEQALLFRAFCEPKRLEILDILRQGEKCACILLEKLNTTQSGLSYHMKILTEAGMVLARPEGKWIHYSLSKEGLDEAITLLKALK